MIRRIVYLFSLLLFWASFAECQKNGIATFSAADVHEFDSVNLPTLTPSFNFPVISKSVGALPGNISFESPQACFQITSTTAACQLPGSAESVALYSVKEPMFDMQPVWTVTVNGNCTDYTVTALTGLDQISLYSLPSTTLYSPSTCGAQTATVTTNDGSGYTVGLDLISGGVGITSLQNTSGWTQSFASPTTTISDAFSNTSTYNNNTHVFTDSLGAQASIQSGGAGASYPWQYTDANGSTQNITLTTGTALNFSPYCNNTGGGTPFTPITSINYPDGTSISIGWDKNGTKYSGLIGSITLRTGGQISYTYNVGSCTEWYNSTLSRTTPDGTWNYSLTTAANKTTTTVKDPGVNKTVYVFIGSGNLGTASGAPSFTSTIDRYQNTGSVASPSYTGGHISETAYCYNTHISDCSTYLPAYPITQLDTYQYTYKPDGTQVTMSHDVKTYDSTYGLLLTDANTDSITSQTITKTVAYGTYSSGSCSAITNTKIVDHPCTVTTKNGTTWLSGSTYTYNSNGALTSSSACLNSTCSSALTTTYTPTTQGTYSAIQDPNGQTTSYTYGSCNSLLPTDVTTTVNSVAIDNKATWSCNGGVKTDTTDANSNENDTTYDSMNRIHTYHDRMGDTNTITYDYGTPTLDHVKVTDNLGVVSYQYNDGLGRPTVSQVCETSGCTTLDTVSHAYGWKDSGNNALTNFQTTTSGGTSSAACTTTTPGTACTTVTLTALTNPIAGPYKTTDANGGTTTYAVNSKDVSLTAGPAPSGENTKVVQTEVDGFGRTTSVCALEASGGTSCGQTMGNSGILTSNTYSYGTGTYTATATRGSQTHTTIADELGRTTSIKIPETGSTARTFTYDTQSTSDNCTGSGGRNSWGDMLRNNLPDGTNYVCFDWDGLHRLTDVGNSIINSTHPCKRFRYDSTANNAYTKPTGYPSSGANLIGRMMEASTDDCTFPLSQAHMLTDEWFAYDAMGRMTDMWETTPNSSGFYHTTVAYDANGNVTSISGIPGSSAYTFVMDGEGRPYNSKLGSTWIVGSSSTTGVTYDAAGAPLTVPLSTGTTNSDAYVRDQLEHMTKYTFTSGSTTMVGVLTWSSIGSLRELNITDGFNSGGTQDCKFGTSTVVGYDDVGRLLDANCGTVFHNSFTYDKYDNITQSGSFSWNPGYSSSNNQFTLTGATYDSNGNVTYDGVNSYSINVYGNLVGTVSGNHSISCGSSGNTCVTFDAFDRIAEVNNAGTFSQVLYSPVGRVARMNGQTTSSAQIAQPGGGATFVSSSGTYFLHPDWLGTKRLSTLMSNGTSLFDTAYAPYSQAYDTFGNLTPQDFTGDLQDIFPGGLFDTPNRELAINEGRWLSPDPAHSGWNAYSYVTDPNTQTDPSGLCDQYVDVGCTEQGQGSSTSGPQGQPICPDGTSGCGPDPLGMIQAIQWFIEGVANDIQNVTNNGISAQEAKLLPAFAGTTAEVPVLYDIEMEGTAVGGGEYTLRVQTSEALPSVSGGSGPPPGPEWETPTFIDFQPDENVLQAARGFAKEYPQYRYAVCGQCGEASAKFQQYAMDRGVYVKFQPVNMHVGGPQFEQATNPMLNYTTVYNQGLAHVVNMTPDGKWFIDMSAMQFLEDGHPEVSYPMIIPVDPENLFK